VRTFVRGKGPVSLQNKEHTNLSQKSKKQNTSKIVTFSFLTNPCTGAYFDQMSQCGA
jgi:hypothetical protein